MAKKAYQIITDEPQGFCIGFKPPGGQYTVDEVELTADDGGDYAYLAIPPGLIISKDENLKGEYPEPDAMVWRSKEEFEEDMGEWITQVHGGASDKEGYAVLLSFEGASGEESDDMTLRDDIWQEIERATGMEFDKDFEGEIYDTGVETHDAGAKQKLQALKQKLDSGVKVDFYLDEGTVTMKVDENEATIDIVFDFDSEEDE